MVIINNSRQFIIIGISLIILCLADENNRIREDFQIGNSINNFRRLDNNSTNVNPLSTGIDIIL